MTKKRKRRANKTLQGNPPASAAGSSVSREAGSREKGKATEERKKARKEKRERTRFDTVRENLEALLVAVILAIIIRHFAVEAFEIPTGSMAPTLFGMHAWLECPNCSAEPYNVAIRSDPTTGEVPSPPFPEERVYQGRCPNPDCTLSLHARAPTKESVKIRDPRELAELVASPFNRQRFPPLRQGGWIQCLGCGTPFQGKREGYRITRARVSPVRCPICHHRYTAVVELSGLTGGHKILVNKFAYQLGKPARWDVIVFEFDQWKNYIKRLIGLPGERIDIFDGDIYVNGKIERKHKHAYVQDAMWRKISDSNVTERGLNRTPAWREVGSRGAGFWKPVRKPRPGQSWSLTNRGQEQPAALEYARGFDNFVNYNLLSPHQRQPLAGEPEDVQVGDRKLAFTVHPIAAGPKGWLGAEIRDGDHAFRLRIPMGIPSDALLERVSNERVPEHLELSRPPHKNGPTTHAELALPLNEPTRIELENVDDRVAVRIGRPGAGLEEVMALEYTSCPDLSNPPVPNGELPHHHVRILGKDVEAEVESIQVYQDFYYINTDLRPPAGDWEGISLEPGQYLALGDNSASSSDGRVWKYVPEENLMGKAILVFWPAWPGNFQCKFIR